MTRIPVGKFEVVMGCHYEATWGFSAGPPWPQPKQYPRGPQVVSGWRLRFGKGVTLWANGGYQFATVKMQLIWYDIWYLYIYMIYDLWYDMIYEIWDMIWYDTTVFGLLGYSSQCHICCMCADHPRRESPWIPRLARCVCCGVRTLVTISIFIHEHRVTTKALHIGAVTKERCFRQDAMAY